MSASSLKQLRACRMIDVLGAPNRWLKAAQMLTCPQGPAVMPDRLTPICRLQIERVGSSKAGRMARRYRDASPRGELIEGARRPGDQPDSDLRVTHCHLEVGGCGCPSRPPEGGKVQTS